MRFPYVTRGDGEEEAMLRAIGAARFEDLLEPVPPELRLDRVLDVPGPYSEYAIARELEAMAAKNAHGGNTLSFLGAGSYDHFVPAAVDHLSFRSEFYTAYTPYQAEVGQGTLTTIFEFQTMMTELTGMDLANASLYDGASALAEAGLLAAAVTGRDRIVVAGPLHPHYRRVLATFCDGQGITVLCDPSPEGVMDRGWLRDHLAGAAAVVVQSPNFFGILEDAAEVFAAAREAGAKAIHVFEPHALPLTLTPADMGADLAVGEGLSLGTLPSYGGPALGLFAARQEFVRRVPGRLIGETVDRDGKRAFVMTLRTREQDIRREKATSNICTNQGLLALRATIYLSLMGPHGLREAAEQCLHKAAYAAAGIRKLDGFRLPYDGPVFHEFVVECPKPADAVVEAARTRGVLPGVSLAPYGDGFGRDLSRHLLVCATEKHTKADLDTLVAVLEEVGRV